MSDLLEIVGKWTAETWSAAASLATFFVALAALLLSIIPIRQARRVREEQAQPYVMAYFEPSEASNHLIDLVVKNFGTTGARDVVPTSNPKLKRSTGTGDATQDVWMFDRLPLLAPGQEWRTFFDSGLSRKETDLPNRYELTLTFKDMRGRKVDPVESVLDLSMYTGRMWTEIYTIHHAAKALREIQKSVKQWDERTGSGLKVFVRSGDARDERRRQELANHRARLDAVSPFQPDSGR